MPDRATLSDQVIDLKFRLKSGRSANGANQESRIQHPVTSIHMNLITILASNAIPLYGVLELNWSVSSVFFWFLFEFVLTGIFTLAALRLCWRRGMGLPRSEIKRRTRAYLWGFALFFTLGSIFFLVTYIGEWRTYDAFPSFVRDKTLFIVLITGFYCLIFWREYFRRKRYLFAEEGYHVRSYAEKVWTITLLYAVLMIYYHGSGASKLTLDRAYLVLIIVVLLITKAAVEMWFSIKRRTLERRTP